MQQVSEGAGAAQLKVCHVRQRFMSRSLHKAKPCHNVSHAVTPRSIDGMSGWRLAVHWQAVMPCCVATATGGNRTMCLKLYCKSRCSASPLIERICSFPSTRPPCLLVQQVLAVLAALHGIWARHCHQCTYKHSQAKLTCLCLFGRA